MQHYAGWHCSALCHKLSKGAHFTTWATCKLWWDHYPPLVMTCFHHENKCHTCSSWASESLAGLANVSAILEQQPFLKCDAATVWDLCVSNARKSLLCNGAHLWWHYTENKCVLAGVCESGHFPLHHRLHMDHHTSLLFTIWLVVELISVVRLYSTGVIQQNEISVRTQCNAREVTCLTWQTIYCSKVYICTSLLLYRECTRNNSC